MKDDKKEELKTKNPKLYNIAVEGGTEAPFTGKYLNEHADGVFHCAVCDAPLFKSENKFESGTGWPSFDRPITPEAVEYVPDDAFGMHRTEVRCKNCGAHLGHIFDDGPVETTGKRYCINSVCLDLEKKDDKSK